MPILATCPHCNTKYKLPDEFGGKTARCKKAECRQQFVVPATQPAAAVPPADIEAAALNALTDAPAEQAAAPQTIPMTCTSCFHPWEEPFEKAGRNVLCPECKTRQKVPVPQKAAEQNWRDGRGNKPSLAKENFEKPDDVMDAAGGGIVTRKALEEAGALAEEVEPRPTRHYVYAGLAAVAVLAGAFFGIKSMWTTRTGDRENRLMADALEQFAKAEEGERPPAAEIPLYSAILHTSAGEYAVRHDSKEKLAEARAEFGKAVEELRAAPGKDNPKAPTTTLERYAVAAELVCAMLELGGTDEQVKAEARLRWVPEAAGNRALRANERQPTMLRELGGPLGLLAPADPDFRLGVLRRMTRELVRRGQPGFAADQLPPLLFPDPAEQPDARAAAALEVLRLNPGSDVPKRVADELAGQARGLKNPVLPNATTLWQAVTPPTDKAPLVGRPPGSGDVPDAARLAYTGLHLLQSQPDEALKLATRPGRTDGRLRALVLCAEWSPDPGPAVDAGVGLVQQFAKVQGAAVPPSLVYRLAQLAAAAGKADRAKELAEAIPDEGLRAWAKGEAVRLRYGPGSKEPADAAAAEVPDDFKKLKAGHVWGRLAVARQNARVTGSRDPKAVAGWPRGAVQPFGLAGLALGLQDGK